MSKVAVKKISPVVEIDGRKKLLTAKQIVFLREYSETGDEVKAAKLAGYSSTQTVLSSEYVREEMLKIQEAFGYEHRLNAKFVGGKHMQLMEKMEDSFDKAHDVKEKAMMGSVLARMSDTAMKSSGRMRDDTEEKPPVVVNINIRDENKE